MHDFLDQNELQVYKAFGEPTGELTALPTPQTP